MSDDVTLFVVPGCPLCSEARAWLDKHGIAYGELDVQNDYSAMRKMFKLTRQKLVPVLKVGEQFAVRPTEQKIVEMC
ncbi:MAG: glutaredoxin family protein [Candidatus Melainabacteria bacterium]|nr:glutaredoxin family protein [Candidatus Melainabacteria bacterium]